MIRLQLGRKSTEPLNILCLGAHSDDIEIGCGGTVLQFRKMGRKVKFHWVVLSASGQRAKEAAAAAELFAGDCEKELVLQEFRDGFMPHCGGAVKDFFEAMKSRIT